MHNKYNFDNNISIRRIITHDLEHIKQLYTKLGRDSVWLEKNTLENVLKYGEMWACVKNGAIITCGGICEPNENLPLTNMLINQDIAINTKAILLPVAGDNKALQYLLSFLNCRIAGKFCGDNYTLILPVKTGANFLATCLKSDMVLIAMRPLFNLRVCYVLCSKAHVELNEQDSLAVNIADSLALSRYLEHGYCATSENNKNITLSKIIKKA